MNGVRTLRRFILHTNQKRGVIAAISRRTARVGGGGLVMTVQRFGCWVEQISDRMLLTWGVAEQKKGREGVAID